MLGLVETLIFAAGATVGIITAVVAVWFQITDSEKLRSETKRQREINRALIALRLIKEDTREFIHAQNERLRSSPSLHTNWMLWAAASIHAWWGISLMFVPPDLTSTDFHGGAAWNTFYELPLPYEAWGALMLLAASCSLLAGFAKQWKLQLVLLLPQQFLLMIGMFGAIAHVLGDWGYDYLPSRELRIFPLMVFPAIFHTVALVDHFLPNIFRKYRVDYDVFKAIVKDNDPK